MLLAADIQQAVETLSGVSSSSAEKRVAARVVLMQAIAKIVNAKKRPVDPSTIRKALRNMGVRVPTPLVQTTAAMAASEGMIESVRPVGISYKSTHYQPLLRQSSSPSKLRGVVSTSSERT